MIIRPETPEDLKSVEQLTLAAFTRAARGVVDEHLIINALREAGELSLSLVAESDGRVIGHIAFSKVTINGSDQDWYGLGPVSVEPELQRQGIGSALIKEGLSRLRVMGAKGCVLEGSPAYYTRFGFKPYPGLYYEGAPAPEYFMALPFQDEIPKGKVEFHKAFHISSQPR